jgi:hypothetical protein
MIKAKVNGKAVEIPTSWEEVKFGKFLRLIDAKDDYYKILSVLLELPEEEIKTAEFIGLDDVIRSIQFLKVPAQLDPFPKKLGDFEIPKDVTFHSVEQFETLRGELMKAANSTEIVEQTKALAMYAAIYCQPMRGDAFDQEKARWLAERFMDYSCVEVMSAGSFFQVKCLSLISGLPMSYLRKNIPLKKKRLDFAGFLKRSGFTRLSTTLRGIWVALMRKPSN